MTNKATGLIIAFIALISSRYNPAVGMIVFGIALLIYTTRDKPKYKEVDLIEWEYSNTGFDNQLCPHCHKPTDIPDHGKVKRCTNCESFLCTYGNSIQVGLKDAKRSVKVLPKWHFIPPYNPAEILAYLSKYDYARISLYEEDCGHIIFMVDDELWTILGDDFNSKEYYKSSSQAIDALFRDTYYQYYQSKV